MRAIIRPSLSRIGRGLVEGILWKIRSSSNNGARKIMKRARFRRKERMYSLPQ